MKYPQSSFVLLLFFFFACSSHSDKTLAEAASIMNQYPDSALHLLQSIRDTHKFTGKQQADYCLLLTQALDKNDLSLNDSLLQIAVEYYSDKTDWDKKANAFFYQGRFHYESGMLEDAARSFKDAEKWAAEAGNDDLSSRIFNHLGHINIRQSHYEKALSFFNRALSLSQKLDNKERSVYNMLEIAKTHHYMDKQDSASIYYEQLSLYLDQCSDGTKEYAYNNIGVFYLEQSNPDKALEYLHRSLDFNTKSDTAHSVFAMLGEIFEMKNERQQAKDYWQKAFSTDYLPTKAYVYYTMFAALLKGERYKEAALCADSCILFIEKANEELHKREILEIQEKYDNESLRVTVLETEFKLLRSILILICVTLSFLFILFFYRRYFMKKEKKMKQKILHKENELDKQKRLMIVLEHKMIQSEEEREELFLKYDKLRNETKIVCDEINKYKQQAKTVDSDTVLARTYLSAIRGRELNLLLLDPKQEVPLRAADDILGIINYCEMTDKQFIDILDSYDLTDLQKMICVLCKMKLDHQRIASCLCIDDESLTRSKTRIKKALGFKGFEYRLEQILLDLQKKNETGCPGI